MVKTGLLIEGRILTSEQARVPPPVLGLASAPCLRTVPFTSGAVGGVFVMEAKGAALTGAADILSAEARIVMTIHLRVFIGTSLTWATPSLCDNASRDSLCPSLTSGRGQNDSSG
jgi:hypothetical protein